MMPIELAVSRAVMRASLAERALHASGDWTVQIDHQTSIARRTICDDQIVFCAEFDEPAADGVQALLYDGVPLSVQPFQAPDFAPFIIEWAVVVAEQSIAA
jgi:hypothetical protein